MKTGTKSLLFGAHQFILHPVCVVIAWVILFRRPPGLRELLCIVIHDWGYWGADAMDDGKGENHPEWAAGIAGKLFGHKWWAFCAGHSRYYAAKHGIAQSRLCAADKMAMLMPPWWVYLPMARAAGELEEYRKDCCRDGAGIYIDRSVSDREWYRIVKRAGSAMAKKISGGGQ